MAEWPGALFTRRKGAFEMFSEVLEDQFCLESQSRQVLPAIFLMYRIVRHLLFKVQTRWSARVFFSDLRIQIVVFRPSYSNRGIQITVFRSAVFKSKTPGSRIAVALKSNTERALAKLWWFEQSDRPVCFTSDSSRSSQWMCDKVPTSTTEQKSERTTWEPLVGQPIH